MRAFPTRHHDRADGPATLSPVVPMTPFGACCQGSPCLLRLLKRTYPGGMIFPSARSPHPCVRNTDGHGCPEALPGCPIAQECREPRPQSVGVLYAHRSRHTPVFAGVHPQTPGILYAFSPSQTVLGTPSGSG